MLVGKDIFTSKFAVLIKICITHNSEYSLSGRSVFSLSPSRRVGVSTTMEYSINSLMVGYCNQPVYVKTCGLSWVNFRMTKLLRCSFIAKTSQSRRIFFAKTSLERRSFVGFVVDS